MSRAERGRIWVRPEQSPKGIMFLVGFRVFWGVRKVIVTLKANSTACLFSCVNQGDVLVFYMVLIMENKGNPAPFVTST